MKVQQLLFLREKRVDASPCLKRRVYERNMMQLEQSRRLNKTTTNLSSVAATHLLTSSLSGHLSSASLPFPV